MSEAHFSDSWEGNQDSEGFAQTWDFQLSSLDEPGSSAHVAYPYGDDQLNFLSSLWPPLSDENGTDEAPRAAGGAAIDDRLGPHWADLLADELWPLPPLSSLPYNNDPSTMHNLQSRSYPSMIQPPGIETSGTTSHVPSASFTITDTVPAPGPLFLTDLLSGPSPTVLPELGAEGIVHYELEQPRSVSSSATPPSIQRSPSTDTAVGASYGDGSLVDAENLDDIWKTLMMCGSWPSYEPSSALDVDTGLASYVTPAIQDPPSGISANSRQNEVNQLSNTSEVSIPVPAFSAFASSSNSRSPGRGETVTPSLFITDDERWEATLSRDPSSEGHFFYCVLSTRIFCRPICPSRRPVRSNVIFVLTPGDARARGCRACKRCKPDESSDPTERRQTEAVERLQRALAGEDSVSTAGTDPAALRKKVTVKKVAEDMGVSMWHLNRLFKRKVGRPPGAWAQERALQATRESTESQQGGTAIDN